MTRSGYLRWRVNSRSSTPKPPPQFSARPVYGDEIIEKVRDLNLKKNFPRDPESRVLEDALCLVFLEFQFAALACKMEEDKIIRTVQKTWQKMSAAAQARALALPLGPKERALVQRALPPVPPTYVHLTRPPCFSIP